MEVGPSEPDAPASTAGIPAIGEVFAQKYRLERSLGRGAMGVIFAAEHVSLRQRVAVKFLLPRAMTLPGASARFLREARAAAAIRSEHVARVIDVGTGDLGVPYLVMEYLRGRDLQREIEARGPLPVSEAVDYVIQGCEAIAEAHARGIVHRDLKPGNLFLTTGATGAPIVKVLDFGLSKSAAAEDDGKLTASEMMLGSPCYMSPEQVRCSKDVDARTDIWSLGVILYQLLTARFPFEVSRISALFVAIATQAPTPPRVHRMDLPARIEDIILRCLEKEPELRVQTVADLAREIAPFGSEHSARALAQIEAIARGKAFPSSRPLGPSGDGVASTLPAAANDGRGASSTLPDADKGAGAGAGPCSTALSPGGDHVTTLPSQGAAAATATSSSADAPSSERRTLPLVAVAERPTLALARSSGPTTPAQDSRPTLKMVRNDRSSHGGSAEDGPTLTMPRSDGLALKMAQGSGSVLATAQGGGAALKMEQDIGPAPATAQDSGAALKTAQDSGIALKTAPEDGPTLTMAREEGPTLTMAREEGPTLTMAGEEGPTLTMAGEEGPTLTMARDDSPTLTMARKRGAPPQQLGAGKRAVPLTQPDGQEIAWSPREGTERRRERWRSHAFRWRRNAGAWIAAAATLLAAVALGAARWTASSSAPVAARSPAGQDAPMTLASTTGPAPFGMPAPSGVAPAPEAPSHPADPAGADSPSAVDAAATTPDPAAVPEHRPQGVRPPKVRRPGTLAPSRSGAVSPERDVYGGGAEDVYEDLETIRDKR
ncbi:Protein kinase [Sorangium cellulosum So ce56]|uniref:Protein kinase n=1 Tax=Sorangium cellulosum (strain So ce56) TaxID=448385 RepID=A9F2Y6_SORC5|nr:serine/threonine-protein kinase [Sorangium cellulosum]CAN94531.1 Protein kinase [Sorangium cellulosum So ce56]